MTGDYPSTEAEWVARGKAIAHAAAERGRLLGRLQSWGLDVYEGSPPQWIDALLDERAGP